MVDEEEGDKDRFNMEEATILVVEEFCLGNLGDNGGEGDAIRCCCDCCDRCCCCCCCFGGCA